MAAAIGGLAWLSMAIAYRPTLALSGERAWLAATLPLAGLLYSLMTVDSAVQHRRGRGAAWKGRTYARPEAAVEEA